MTSLKRIEANRRNSLKSTGPKTETGKQASRCNAVRHGLTAETVMGALEDAEDYKAFEAAITADYDAQSAVERELVLRLASLLWRLRRATTIETGLFEIQARLHKVLAEPGIEIMPGCFDAISAKLVADAGFKVTFMSGFAVSAARLGLPDTGLISFAEMLDTLRNCCSAAPDVPVIGDGDTGYGNAINVQRTVIEYARAGAAAVMIEDQVSPKKCGHTRGKQVITRDEARMKIRAAADAKRDVDILILARTDARAVHGFDEALARCRDFEAEGADIIFLEAPENEAEMTRFCEAIQKPCMANMVPGGKTPVLPPKELQQIGYKLALYPVALLTSAIAAMQTALAALRPESGKSLPPSISFAELQKVVGFPGYWTQEIKYQVRE